MSTTIEERRRALVLLLAPLGVLVIGSLVLVVGIPLSLAWPDIKHQLTLDGLREFQHSTGYALPRDAKLIHCEDSRGGWHGDGTLHVHLQTKAAQINDWTSQPFKNSDWHAEFRRPEFVSASADGPSQSEPCYWARWGDPANWRLIIVQPTSGMVWYSEFNS